MLIMHIIHIIHIQQQAHLLRLWQKQSVAICQTTPVHLLSVNFISPVKQQHGAMKQQRRSR